MAIDPKLVSIKTAGELPVSDPSDNANFLFYENEELKRSPMANIYDKVSSGLLPATTSTVPGTTGFERYIAHEAGTYTNFVSGGLPIEVTSADLDVVSGVANNRVILEVQDGVATKRVERVKGDTGAAADPAKLPLYSSIKSANIAAGTQFIDDENGNIQYRVKTGQTLLTTDVPANVVGTKVDIIGDAFQRSSFSPLLKDAAISRDFHTNSVLPLTANATGFAFMVMSSVLTTEKYFNSLSHFIYATKENLTVTVSIYSTSVGQAQWNPSEATTTLLAQKTINNFNTDPLKRTYVFFDTPIKNTRGKNLVIIFESSDKNLVVYIHPTQGGTIGVLERRIPQNNYYLDSTGRNGYYPILEYVTEEKKFELSKPNPYRELIVIPPVILAVVGSELNLYPDSVLDVANGLKEVKVRFRNVSAAWSGVADNSGITNFSNRLKFTPTTAGQSHYFSVDVMKNNEVVATKNFEIRTIAKKTAVTGQKNIVVAGDSTIEYISNQGNTARNLHEMLVANSGITPKMVGSKSTATTGVMHEGYSGQSIGYFNGTSSPFYIGGEINFQAYASAKGVSQLDYILMQVGINSVGSGIKQDETYYNGVFFTSIIDAYKVFIDKALSADKGFPNCKIILSMQPYGANGENFLGSRSTDELKRKMFTLFRLMLTNFYNNGTAANYHANVWLAPAYLSIDRVNSYPFEMQAPNAYDDSGTVIFQHTDTVHPNAIGYKQVAATFHNYIQQLLS